MGKLIFTNKDDSSKSAKIEYVSNHETNQRDDRFSDLNTIINLYHKLHEGDEILTYYDGIEVSVELNAAETYSLVEPEPTEF